MVKILRVKPEKIKYTDLSRIHPDYTNKMNKAYNWMAKVYGAFMLVFPVWKKWIKNVIPHIKGNTILEISFGNGYLMSQYASNQHEIYGIDYNEKMVEVTRKKMKDKGLDIHLLKGNVEKLPFPDNSFDTIINTMAFTGYPDGNKALGEINRVLKPGGRLLLVDFDYPKNRNVIGFAIVRLWEKFGDIIKDIDALLTEHNFEFEHTSVGGFGSVHLYIALK